MKKQNEAKTKRIEELKSTAENVSDEKMKALVEEMEHKTRDFEREQEELIEKCLMDHVKVTSIYVNFLHEAEKLFASSGVEFYFLTNFISHEKNELTGIRKASLN